MKKKSVPTLKKFGNTLTVWNSKSMTKSGHCLNIANYYSRNKVKGRAISLFPLFSKLNFFFHYFFLYLCSITRFYSTPMVKKELSETEIAESIPDLWQPLTQEQKRVLGSEFYNTKYIKRMKPFIVREKLPCT